MPAVPPARRVLTALAGACAAAVLLAGCTNFPDAEAPKTWQPQHELTPEQGPEPELPGGPATGRGAPGGSSAPEKIPPPKGCQDFDPAVIGTCLDEVSAVAALPGSQSEPAGLAGERNSGDIFRVHKGSHPRKVASIPVDPTGGGGLSGLALSPSYDEDQIVYAYVTTRRDNRVVRFTVGDTPKPVLTGIPRGRTGNRGALALDHTGALLVATGDAGNASPGPRSLAGKVLRINPSGKPAKGNPRRDSPIVAAGLHAPGGVCNSASGTSSWVTDRRPDADALYKLDLSGNLGQAAWTWRENRPGVAGCAAFSDSLMVAGSSVGNVQNFALNPDGTFGGAPRVIMAGDGGYGRIDGMDVVGDAGAMIGTMNKAPGGKPVSSDDRVAIVLPQSGGGGGKD